MRTKIQDMCRRPGFPVNLSFSEVDCFNEKMLATLRKKIKDQINSAQLRGQKIMGGLVPQNYVVRDSLEIFFILFSNLVNSEHIAVIRLIVSALVMHSILTR